MIGLLIGIGVLLAAVLQVTFAPYFPIAGAAFDVPLIALVLVMRFGGPRATMAAIPFAAIVTAFLTDRSPALLLVAYLPLLPLAYWLDEWGPPVGDFVRTLLATAGTGLWARAVLTLAALASGAVFEPVPIVARVLVPGIAMDVALLAVAYLPFRFIGWQERSTRLQRGSYSPL